jgi:sialate O-acetylesterase
MKFKMLYSLLFFVLQIQVYAQEQTFKLATAIQSNMVVQQNKAFKIWGLAKANEPISAQASWNGKTVSTTATSSGEWLLQLAVPKAKPGDFKAHHITIKHTKGEIKLDNILIGRYGFAVGNLIWK